MWTKRILLFLPFVVAAVLLSSYFWVPTYEQQARATPERLEHYINGAIGDAQILNPILNADTASSGICDLVFEGLIDRDENLNWRGRLATSWEISEVAYLAANPKDPRTAEQLADLIRAAKTKHEAETSPRGNCFRNITAIATEPAATITQKVTEEIPNEKDKEAEPKRVEVSITVHRPPRVKLTLKEVDQDLFTTLGEVVGKDYVASFKGTEHIDVKPAEFEKDKAKYAAQFMPACEHNPVILFHLRNGVKFQDGHEFDSGDVKFTYEAMMDPKNLSPRVSDYDPVKSVECVDKYAVRVVYKELFSPAFGSWGMGILPEHLLNNEALAREARGKGKKPEEFSMRDSDFNIHPIGCGPFRFVEWKHDQYIKLARFDAYWEGAPEYKEYLFRIIPDAQTQELEFYAGAVDGYTALPHQVARLEKDPRFQCFKGLSFGYSYIGYNMRRDLFKDKRVRRALGMAIDVDRIIQFLLYNQAEPITGPFVKQTDFYDHSIQPLKYDPKEALRLLADAGWKPGKTRFLEKDGKPFEFTLMTNSGNNIRRDIMTIVQDCWSKIGVECKTEMRDWPTFLGEFVDKGNFDAVVLGWSMGIEPDLYQIWHSSQDHPNQLNFCAFKNTDADDLIVRIRQEYDEKKQVEMCHRLHHIIVDEQPYTFLFVNRWTALLDKKIFIVRRDDKRGVTGYERIKPTKTGNYSYYFNRWVKLPAMPQRVLE